MTRGRMVQSMAFVACVMLATSAVGHAVAQSGETRGAAGNAQAARPAIMPDSIVFDCWVGPVSIERLCDSLALDGSRRQAVQQAHRAHLDAYRADMEALRNVAVPLFVERATYAGGGHGGARESVPPLREMVERRRRAIEEFGAMLTPKEREQLSRAVSAGTGARTW